MSRLALDMTGAEPIGAIRVYPCPSVVEILGFRVGRPKIAEKSVKIGREPAFFGLRGLLGDFIGFGRALGAGGRHFMRDFRGWMCDVHATLFKYREIR